MNPEFGMRNPEFIIRNKMIRYLSFISILVLLAACQGKQVPKAPVEEAPWQGWNKYQIKPEKSDRSHVVL